MRARAVEGLDRDGPLSDAATRIVALRLDELRGFSEAALAPEAATAQHDMRIAAKRLRYVLEILGPCLGRSEAAAARKLASQLQSALGGVHDCDVMESRVEGARALQEALAARRRRLHGEFRELWLSEESQATLARLERQLD